MTTELIKIKTEEEILSEKNARLFGKACDIASEAHEGQVDNGGKPYFKHVFHVASQFFFDDEGATVAVLHDVIEDTSVTIERLRSEGFSNDVLDAIIAITKRKGEEYSDYLERVISNPLARSVKIEDLRHNMDLSRLPSLADKDIERIKKYHAAYIYLRGDLC